MILSKRGRNLLNDTKKCTRAVFNFQRALQSPFPNICTLYLEMDEAHYDTPWEFKNRGIAALRHSVSPSTSGSSPTVNTSPMNERHLSERLENDRSPLSPRRSTSNQQFVSPSSESLKIQSSGMKRTHFPVMPTPSATSTPTEQRRRRSDKAERAGLVLNLTNIMNEEKIDRYYPHVRNHSYGGERTTPQNSSRRHLKLDEAHLIHERLDRVDAEKLLQPMEAGDFLLRRRPEGNLALSLRASDGKCSSTPR